MRRRTFPERFGRQAVEWHVGDVGAPDHKRKSTRLRSGHVNQRAFSGHVGDVVECRHCQEIFIAGNGPDLLDHGIQLFPRSPDSINASAIGHGPLRIRPPETPVRDSQPKTTRSPYQTSCPRPPCAGSSIAAYLSGASATALIRSLRHALDRPRTPAR